MAYYEGETLREKVASGQLAVAEAVEIAIQVAQGLARAHEAGIIHRDIKPANIIITKRGEVKILDFGLATLAGQQHLTKTGATMGTIVYMSPEQAQSLPVDHRTDIWSLGVVMYEMLTGQLPFQGHFDQAVMYAIVNVEAEPVRSLRPDVSVGLERIVNKALQKPLSARYQSTDEFLSDLRVLDTSEKAGTKSSTSKQNKIRSSIFAGLLLLAVIISAVILMRFNDFSLQPKKSAFTTDSSNRIAIFPFTVRGSEKFAYLKSLFARGKRESCWALI
jgi:serine/threonine protein kinase